MVVKVAFEERDAVKLACDEVEGLEDAEADKDAREENDAVDDASDVRVPFADSLAVGESAADLLAIAERVEEEDGSPVRVAIPLLVPEGVLLIDMVGCELIDAIVLDELVRVGCAEALASAVSEVDGVGIADLVLFAL